MCGLFGIINSEPKTLDRRAFLTLGVINDTRGGDSCGVFIDGQIEYGYDKLKLFADFWSTSEILKNTSKCTIAMGHCRKASVGGIGLRDEKAQPVVLKNDEGKIEFVLTHNGTIKNYEELAKKYIPDIDIKGLTDSQVMARIFYHAGYDVLGEYIGAGVFITADYRGEKPVMHFFKGESKQYPSSVNLSEERPLFFVQQGKSFIYSSISDFLYTLFPGLTVYKINGNLLCTLRNNELVTVKSYDRSELYQSKYTSTGNANTHSPYKGYDYSGYGRDWDEDDIDDRYPAYGGGRAQGSGFQQQGQKETQKAQETQAQKVTVPTVVTQPVQLRLFDKFYDTPADDRNVGSYILGDRESLTYKIANRETPHGIYKCSHLGCILKGTDVSKDFKLVYFFAGVPVKSAHCLDFLRRVCEAWECTGDDLMGILPQLVYSLSPFPFKNSGISKDSKINVMVDTDICKPYDGKVALLFTDYYYMCKDGFMSLTRYVEDYDKVWNFYEKFASYQVPDTLTKEFLTTYENC